LKEKTLPNLKTDNPFDFNCTNVGKTFSDCGELKAEKIPRTYKTPDDKVMEDMQRQFRMPDSLKDKSMD
jgi:hypothetical protein